MAWGRLRNRNRRWYLKKGTSYGGDCISNVPNGHVFFRSHVIWPARLPSEQYRPKPNSQVGRVQIRTIGRAIAVYVYSPALERIASKISDREVSIQWQIRTDERPTTGNESIEFV